jgi:hypothetical protein
MDLVLHIALFRGMAATVVIRAKEGFYQDRYPTNLFLLLAIEIFERLHQQIDNFLHHCVNMAWVAKGSRSLPLLILHAFHK